jgi:hypothetical protein
MLFLPTAAIVSCLLVIPSALCTMTAIQVVDSMQNAIAICKNTNVALQSLSTSDTVVKVGAVGGVRPANWF